MRLDLLLALLSVESRLPRQLRPGERPGELPCEFHGKGVGEPCQMIGDIPAWCRHRVEMMRREHGT